MAMCSRAELSSFLSSIITQSGALRRMSAPQQDGPRVLIVGFGALGALYGFLLARGGAKVFAVARSNADSLMTRGIDIDSQKYGRHDRFRPQGVFRTAEECKAEASVRPFDYVLTTIKICPEQRKTGELLREYFPEPKDDVERSRLPTVVFVENGIGIEEEPYEVLCKAKPPRVGTIITCSAWLGATLTEQGTKVEHGVIENLEMGLYPYREEGEQAAAPAPWRQAALQRFADTYLAGQGGAKVIEGDIQVRRWKKVFWNAAWGGLSTLARQPVKELLLDENLDMTVDAVRKIMFEILSVVRACGYDEKQFTQADMEDAFNLTYTQAPKLLPKGQLSNLRDDFKPSLLVDLEANRPMELSPIVGNVVAKAHQHGLQVPRLELILAALRPALFRAINQTKK